MYVLQRVGETSEVSNAQRCDQPKRNCLRTASDWQVGTLCALKNERKTEKKTLDQACGSENTRKKAYFVVFPLFSSLHKIPAQFGHTRLPSCFPLFSCVSVVFLGLTSSTGFPYALNDTQTRLDTTGLQAAGSRWRQKRRSREKGKNEIFTRFANSGGKANSAT